MIEMTSPRWTLKPTPLTAQTPPNMQVDVLDPEEVLGDPLGDRVVLPFFGNGEQGLVAGGDQVGAEHLQFGSFADFLADFLRGADANSAQAEGDVRVLAAGSEPIPSLRRDDAADVVDQEVPTPAGCRELAIDLVIERVHILDAREPKVREIALEYIQRRVEGLCGRLSTFRPLVVTDHRAAFQFREPGRSVGSPISRDAAARTRQGYCWARTDRC